MIRFINVHNMILVPDSYFKLHFLYCCCVSHETKSYFSIINEDLILY
jgi:hypothetical protein